MSKLIAMDAAAYRVDSLRGSVRRSSTIRPSGSRPAKVSGSSSEPCSRRQTMRAASGDTHPRGRETAKQAPRWHGWRGARRADAMTEPHRNPSSTPPPVTEANSKLAASTSFAGF
jgi:hypothetical protein